MIRFAVAFFTLAVWASMAFAAPSDPFGKALMARIKAEGFRIESIKTTLLRRVQIESRSNSSRRQTVYNPVNGVVLRDFIFPIDEESLLSHVSEILGVDLRSGREGRSKPDIGTSDNGKSKQNNGKSDGKGRNGGDKPGNGNSGETRPGKGKSN